MSDFDSTFDDEILSEENSDNEQMRHGYAIVHHKLFPKYGFLIPEIPLYHGETIFFGLTAHEGATHKFIADLRDELRAGQRVEFMAVATEREGTVRWKAIVVTPLDEDSNNNEQKPGVVNQMWLECTVHNNLCSTHGFATPIGGNPYYDNVYFTLREASAGLEMNITDLTEVFNPGDSIRALVVPADSKFRAKYQAVMICKSNKQFEKVPSEENECNVSSLTASMNNNNIKIDASDIPAVQAICDTLLSKEDDDGVKLTSLAGDISSNSEVRAAVLPQKKALKRFLAKYPQYFVVKEDTVHSAPNISINELKLQLEAKKNEIATKKENEDDTEDKSNEDISNSIPPVENNTESISNNKEKSASDVFAVFQSEHGVKMLADILVKYGRPMKIGDLLKSCQQQGWAGMKTTAMLTQLIQKKKLIFAFDEAGHIYLTEDGKKQIILGQKRKEDPTINKPPMNNNDKKINLNEFPTPLESMLLRLSQPNSSFPQAEITQSDILGSNREVGSSVFNNTNSNLVVGSRMRPAFTTTIAASLGTGIVSSNINPISRKAYTPVMLPGGDFFKTNNDTFKNAIGAPMYPKPNASDFNDLSLSQGIFPNGDLIPSKTSPYGVIGESYLNNIYDSDTETNGSSQFGASIGLLQSRNPQFSPEELIYLQVVSRAVFFQQNKFEPKVTNEKDNITAIHDLFQVLKKELENLSVVSPDMEEQNLKGILSKHLICIHLDEGFKPRAKFQYFAPSGSIQQSTVTLNTGVVKWVAINSMIHNDYADIVNVMFESFYGIKNSFHWIRFLPNIEKQLVGCTVKFNVASPKDIRPSDHTRFGDNNRLKVVFSDKGTTSTAANTSLRKYVLDKNESMSVYVIDMHAQILGFKKYESPIRRSICNDLSSQQKFIENAVDFCPDYVVINAVDSKLTLEIIKRLLLHNIRVFAEVYRPLEKTLHEMF